MNMNGIKAIAWFPMGKLFSHTTTITRRSAKVHATLIQDASRTNFLRVDTPALVSSMMVTLFKVMTA